MKLELRGITKRFGSLVANDHIDLVVEPGEIHCLLGENGAGKSTLMNVLYGLYQADEGVILLDDHVQNFHGPGDAMRAGIGMVHQHFMLIPVFTVAENVMLGHESTTRAAACSTSMPRARGCARSRRGSGSTSTPTPWSRTCPVGVQQRVEIIKALSRDAKVLVFDEPTAVLTPAGDRRADGDHAPAQGSPAPPSSSSPTSCARCARSPTASPSSGSARSSARRRPPPSNAELASMMVGRAVELTVHKDAADAQRPRARRRGPHACIDPLGQVVVNDVSFDVRGGEILAIAGVQGNGQTELTEALLGLQPLRAGLGRRSTARSSSARACAASSTRASASSPRTATRTGSSARSRSPRTSCSTAPTARRSSRRGNVQRGDPRRVRRRRSSREFDVRAPGIDTPVGHAVRRQPAEGRARPRAQPRALAASSRRSRPAASTSGRSSSSTSASSRRATPASRSSSSRPSSTRSPRSPTASW